MPVSQVVTSPLPPCNFLIFGYFIHTKMGETSNAAVICNRSFGKSRKKSRTCLSDTVIVNSFADNHLSPNHDIERGELEERAATKISRKWYQINKGTIPLKIDYFCLGLKDVAYIQYRSLFLLDIGLTLSKVGLITGLKAFGSILGSILLGLLADYCGRYHLVSLFTALFVIVLTLPQPWIANLLDVTNEVAFLHTNNITNNTKCCANQTRPESPPMDKDTGENWTLFYIFLAFYVLLSFFDKHLAVSVDAVVSAYDSESSIDYGKQRLFHPIGIAVGSLVMSACLNTMPEGISKYSIMHFTYSFAVICYIVISFFLYNRRQNNFEVIDDASDKEKEKSLKTLKTLLCKVDTVFLFSAVMIIGMLLEFIHTFLLVLVTQLHPHVMMIGVVTFVGEIVNIVTFFFAADIVRICKGPQFVLVLIFICFCVRCLLYGFAISVYMVLVGQIFTGMGFGMMNVVIMENVKEVPKQVATSMIGVALGVFEVGRVVGSIGGGVVYEDLGGRVLYRIGAGISLSCAITVLIFVKYRKRSSTA